MMVQVMLNTEVPAYSSRALPDDPDAWKFDNRPTAKDCRSLAFPIARMVDLDCPPADGAHRPALTRFEGRGWDYYRLYHPTCSNFRFCKVCHTKFHYPLVKAAGDHHHLRKEEPTATGLLHRAGREGRQSNFEESIFHSILQNAGHIYAEAIV